MRLWMIAVAILPLAAEKRIQLDSATDQKSYVVNLEDRKLLAQLRSASANVPSWLIPPGVTPSIRQAANRVTATFKLGGSVAESANYYSQLLASRSFTVAPLVLRGRMTTLTGTQAQVTIHVTLMQDGEAVEAQISAPYASAAVSPTAQLDVLLYDDSTGQLRLRDRGTAAEYILDRAAIRSLSTGGTASASIAAAYSGPAIRDFPSFVPIYPNGRIDRKLAPLRGKHAGLELRIATHDSTKKAEAWYRAALQRAGLTIVNDPRIGGIMLGNTLTAVDASGTHLVKVSIGPSFSMPALVCDENPVGSPIDFSKIGKCRTSDPEATAVSLSYERLR